MADSCYRTIFSDSTKCLQNCGTDGIWQTWDRTYALISDSIWTYKALCTYFLICITCLFLGPLDPFWPLQTRINASELQFYGGLPRLFFSSPQVAWNLWVWLTGSSTNQRKHGLSASEQILTLMWLEEKQIQTVQKDRKKLAYCIFFIWGKYDPIKYCSVLQLYNF